MVAYKWHPFSRLVNITTYKTIYVDLPDKVLLTCRDLITSNPSEERDFATKLLKMYVYTNLSYVIPVVCSTPNKVLNRSFKITKYYFKSKTFALMTKSNFFRPELSKYAVSSFRTVISF